MIVIDKCLFINLGGVRKHLVAVKPVLISANYVPHHQLEQICKQVHLRTCRFYRIIQRGVGVLLKQNLTVYITPPYDVFRHLCRNRKRNACTRSKVLGVRRITPLLLPTACCRLGVQYVYTAEQHEHSHGKNTQQRTANGLAATVMIM